MRPDFFRRNFPKGSRLQGGLELQDQVQVYLGVRREVLHGESANLQLHVQIRLEQEVGLWHEVEPDDQAAGDVQGETGGQVTPSTLLFGVVVVSAGSTTLAGRQFRSLQVR